MLDAEIIVVGAGPAGTSTALHLARLGLDVLVLDRAHFPRDKPCSEYMSPEASRILASMGALGAIESAGAASAASSPARRPRAASPAPATVGWRSGGGCSTRFWCAPRATAACGSWK